jgi:hypothetical protein
MFTPATGKKDKKTTRARTAGNPTKNFYTYLTKYKYRLLAVQVWEGGGGLAKYLTPPGLLK